jgi:hypothetical protein
VTTLKFIQFKQSYTVTLIEIQHRFLFWTWNKWYQFIPGRNWGKESEYAWVKLPEFTPVRQNSALEAFLDRFFRISLKKGLTSWKFRP